MEENKTDENSIDAVDEFLSRYKKSVRHTESVRTYRPKITETKISNDGSENRDRPNNTNLDKTREIDPRATFNPVIQRRIIAKKIRTPEDDEDEIKQVTFADRFEKQPELPDNKGIDGKTVFFNTSEFPPVETVRGQQSFFDEVPQNNEKKRSIIIEQKEETDDNEDEITVDDDSSFLTDDVDDISSLFNSLSKEHKFEVGKSEKLRAIARTASDDGVEKTKQLIFPGFESEKADVVEEEKIESDLKKKRLDVVSAFMKRGGVKKEESDKIEYDTVLDEEKKEKNRKNKTDAFMNFQNDVNTFVNSHQKSGIQPDVEYTQDDNKDEILQYIRKRKKSILLRLGVTGIPDIVLVIVSVILSVRIKNSESVSSGGINFFAIVCMLMSFVCLFFYNRDFSHWLKQIGKRKFTSYVTVTVMFILCAVQSILLLFSDEKTVNSALLLAPAGLFVLLLMYMGRYIIYDNLKLCFSLYSEDKILNVLKSFGDSGLAGEMLSGLKNSGGDKIKYSAKTRFVSGFMKCAVNAVPEEPYVDMFSLIFLCISLLAGFVIGIVKGDVCTGVSVATGAVIIFVPTSYILTASIMLYGENKKLASVKSAIPSYMIARDVSHSTAIILDASDIIEQNSCTIHGVQTFNNADAEKSMIYAAAVVIKAKTPLQGIFERVISESSAEIPETEQLVYEEKLGVSTWIENKRVLFGSLDFMRHHNILLPDGDDPATGSRKTVFLAVDDNLWAMFVVSYHIKRSVSSFLRNTVNRGMSVLINTSDQNITEKFIEKKCRLPENSVKVISARIGEYFRQIDENTENSVNVSAITNGKITSLAKMFASSFKLYDCRRISAIISYIGAAMGILLITVFGIIGSLDVMSCGQIIIYRIFWIIIALLIPLFVKRQ